MNKQRKPIIELNGGTGAEVINNNLNAAIRSWKKQLKDFNTISEIRSRRFYTKPSKFRRNVKNNAIFLEKFRQK